MFKPKNKHESDALYVFSDTPYNPRIFWSWEEFKLDLLFQAKKSDFILEQFSSQQKSHKRHLSLPE
jgi:hypothetical protein